MFVFCFSRTTLTIMSPGAAVLADDHALVDLLARADEQLAARLQVVERVAGRRADAVGEHRPALAVGQLAGPRHPAGVVGVQQRRAAGGGQQQPSEPDEPAGRRLERDDGAAGIAGAQVGHPTLARARVPG